MSEIRMIRGRAVSLRGNDIDTDRIIPARFLKEISFARMGEYPFFDERFQADGSEKDHPFNRRERQGASLLIVNDNFGCGSSREHAPQALYRWGIRAVIAETLAEIFAGNCAMIGMPGVTMAPEEIEELQALSDADPALEFSLDLESKTLSCGARRFPVEIPESRRRALTDGSWDSTGLLLSHLDRARKTAESLPYIRGFL
jgi:3-isopropylmalate/(R)-2-methylmalate dehydratase small subunit